MVKKPLGEYLPKNCETTECDRNPVRNFRSSFPALSAVPGQHDESQDPAGQRHEDKKLNC